MERDCKNCEYMSENGCTSWECKYKEEITSKEELILRSCIYAVSQMLEKGNCVFCIKSDTKTERVDYTESLHYLADKLFKLKENNNE